MENKIINPFETKPQEPMPDEAMLRAMEKYNKEKGDAKGEWVYSQEHGIVWNPKPEDLMGGTPSLPNPTTPHPLLGELVEWGKPLDLDSIKPNSVMIIKLSNKNQAAAMRMQQGIISMVLAPRAEKLKDKKLTVLFMSSDDDISLLDEAEMEEAGWQKKQPSIIIRPS